MILAMRTQKAAARLEKRSAALRIEAGRLHAEIQATQAAVHPFQGWQERQKLEAQLDALRAEAAALQVERCTVADELTDARIETILSRRSQAVSA